MKINRVILSIFLLFLIYDHSLFAAEATYQIDSKQSRLMIHAGTAGAFGFAGHSHEIAARIIKGTVRGSAENPESSSVEITVKSDSLEETEQFSAKDLTTINTKMKDEVLEVSKYPDIVFKSSKVALTKRNANSYEIRVDGDLSLHGISKPISIPMTVRLNGSSLKATGQFTILRDDFNINTASAGGGTVKVSKELKVSIEIVASS